MNILRTDIDAVNAILTLQVSESDYAEKVEKTLKDYRKKANVPGFRVGMAPMGLIKKMYGRGVKADELNKIMQEELYKYIKDNNLDVLGEPLPNKADEERTIDFEADKDFEFKFDIALAPAFEPAVNKDITLTEYDIVVTDEMIENQVQNYAARFGKYSTVDEITDAKDMLKGNLYELDGNGQVKEDGIKVTDAVMSYAYMKDDAQKALFEKAKNNSVIVFNPKKAFENEAEISSMLKISKDEAKDLAADFQMEVTSITHYEKSPVDTTLFDKVYGEGVVKTEEEFRTKVAEGIKDSYAEDSNYKFGLDAQEEMLKQMENLVFPVDFLKRWALATNENLTAETVEKDFDLMLKDLKWYIFKNKIAKANNIEVAPEDINAFAKKMAKIQFAQYGMTAVPDDVLENYAKEMMGKQETMRNITEKAFEDKVVNFIHNNVTVAKQEISVEDFNKMFE